MDYGTLIIGLALIFGLYMAWNIGANDVANAMGTSVGSKALTIKQAIIIAAIFEFAGAFLVGGSVTNTIRKGMFDPMIFSDHPATLAIGMLSALLAAALWLQMASLRGLPVSTTHSVVGAVIGFAVVAKGFGAVQWGKIFSIIMSWFVSPVLGGLIAYLTFIIVRRLFLHARHPMDALQKRLPGFMFICGGIMGLVIFFKGLKNLHLELDAIHIGLIAILSGCFSMICGLILTRQYRTSPQEIPVREQISHIERIFVWLQIATACMMAFGHGANDVANAIGPLAGIVSIVEHNAVTTSSVIPIWILALGGVGIVIGLWTFGARVMKTIGKDITEVTPTRGFAAEFGAALTILIGSQLGLPLSTTHILVGAVIGVGFARGMNALNFGIIKNVATSWLITVPIAAVLSVVIYLILSALLPEHISLSASVF